MHLDIPLFPTESLPKYAMVAESSSVQRNGLYNLFNIKRVQSFYKSMETKGEKYLGCQIVYAQNLREIIEVSESQKCDRLVGS